MATLKSAEDASVPDVLEASPAAPTEPIVPTAPPGKSWWSYIREELGGGELVLLNEEMHWYAANLEGRRVQLPDAEGDVIVDTVLDVLWFSRRSDICQTSDEPCSYDLRVLDLLGATSVERVYEGFPARPVPKHLGKQAIGSAWEYDGGVRFDLRRPGKFTLVRGVYSMVFDEDEESDAVRDQPLSRVQILSDATVKSLARRLERPSRTVDCKAPSRRRVASVLREQCVERSLCGEATRLPNTHLQVVIVAHDCGDACHVQRCLYEPTQQQFLDPANPQELVSEPGDWCTFEALEVSGSGQHWIHDGTVISVSEASGPPVYATSWLTGGCLVD